MSNWYYKLRDVNWPLQGHQSTSDHFLDKNAIVVGNIFPLVSTTTSIDRIGRTSKSSFFVLHRVFLS